MFKLTDTPIDPRALCDAAFDACRSIIDSIKSTVPIWKKEHYTDGTSIWVKCHSCAEHGHHH